MAQSAILKTVSGTRATLEIESSIGVHAYATLINVRSGEILTFNNGSPFDAFVLEMNGSIKFQFVDPTTYAARAAYCDDNGFYECQTINTVAPTSADDIAHKIYAIIDPE